jgi:hypothetical protein
MVMAAAKWNQLRGRVVKRMKKSYVPSFRDAPLGADPESILPEGNVR